MSVASQHHQIRQHLVPHSCSMGSHNQPTLAEHPFHWSRSSWQWEYLLKQRLQLVKWRISSNTCPRRIVSLNISLTLDKIQVTWNQCMNRNIWATIGQSLLLTIRWEDTGFCSFRAGRRGCLIWVISTVVRCIWWRLGCHRRFYNKKTVWLLNNIRQV